MAKKKSKTLAQPHSSSSDHESIIEAIRDGAREYRAEIQASLVTPAYVVDGARLREITAAMLTLPREIGADDALEGLNRWLHKNAVPIIEALHIFKDIECYYIDGAERFRDAPEDAPGNTVLWDPAKDRVSKHVVRYLKDRIEREHFPAQMDLAERAITVKRLRKDIGEGKTSADKNKYSRDIYPNLRTALIQIESEILTAIATAEEETEIRNKVKALHDDVGDERKMIRAKNGHVRSQHPELTIDRAVFLFQRLCPKWERMNQASISEVIAFFTSFDVETVRQAVNQSYRKDEKSPHGFKADIKIVEKYLTALGLEPEARQLKRDMKSD